MTGETDTTSSEMAPERSHGNTSEHDPSVRQPTAGVQGPSDASCPLEESQPPGPTISTSLLLGATAGMAIAGLAVRIESSLGDNGLAGRSARAAVVGAALIMVAVGIRLPQKLAALVCAWAYVRIVRRGRPSDLSDVYLNPVGGDRRFRWMVLSVIALITGASMALLPLMAQMGETVYGWMLDRFLWSHGPLVVLQVLIAFLIALVPLAILGLAASGLHHLCCPYGRWGVRTTAWLLLGAACGVLAANWIGLGSGRGDLIMMASSLPALVLSLVAATSNAARSDPSRQRHDTEGIPLPIWSDSRPARLRLGVVAVGAGGVCALIVWEGYFQQTGRIPDSALPMMLAAMGIGIGIGCRSTRSGARSTSGFGLACAAAGIVVAVSAVPSVNIVHAGSASIAWSIYTLVNACVSTAAIGWAMAYGWRTLLSRVANRSDAGVTVLTNVLLCAAFAIWVGVPAAGRIISAPAFLSALALTLVCLGGAFVIHEPGGSSRTRRLRLCAVFGSMGAMIATAWFAPRLWQQGLIARRLAPAVSAADLQPYPLDTVLYEPIPIEPAEATHNRQKTDGPQAANPRGENPAANAPSYSPPLDSADP